MLSEEKKRKKHKKKKGDSGVGKLKVKLGEFLCDKVRMRWNG
jgi:hypothetical protein